jgi:hypothetical protein
MWIAALEHAGNGPDTARARCGCGGGRTLRSDTVAGIRCQELPERGSAQACFSLADKYATGKGVQNAPIETTAYFSEIFEMNAGKGAVENAFAQLLSTKYGYKGQVGCGMAQKGPTILAKLKDDHARFVKQLNQQGIKVVETGWAYAGGS